MSRPILVLIVEDDPALSNLYDEKFKREGFGTIVAKDGKSGLEIAFQKLPDFILLDILLPKMNGLDFLVKLRQHPTAGSIPVIVLTNLAERSEQERALKLGAKEYLAKAMHSPEDIVNRAKSYLRLE